uniref:CARD domain-containing protein n=1 Tax=Oryzias sinensis TaxID=183150 RepID=A0A8C7WTI0_9TELE
LPLSLSSKLLAETLEDLTKENFQKFVQDLVDRRSRVDEKNFLVVADLIVVVFSEKNVLKEAAEVLRGEFGRLWRRVSLCLSPSFFIPFSAKEFVQKYKMQLIKKVADPDPLFDLLLHKKVLSDHSYFEFKALPTDEKKMSKLLMGPYLEAKPACDIFYDFLKKEQPYLVFDLLQK